MNESFLKIAVTYPSYLDNESQRITKLLSEGEVDIMHIRKPDWNLKEMEAIIKEIPSQYHEKFKIHDHFRLMEKYNLRGIHLNSRNKTIYFPVKNISKSVHAIKELEDIESFEYVMLSPIFDSISKTGYKSKFNLKEISSMIINKKVVALGGVTPDKFGILKCAGFIGAAMLGYYWK